MIKKFLSISESPHHTLRGEEQALRKPLMGEVHSQQNEGRQLKGVGVPCEPPPAGSPGCLCTHPCLSSAPVPWAQLQWAEQRVASHPPLATDGALQGAPSTAWERSHSSGMVAGGGYQSPKELRDHGILQPGGQFLSHAH